MSDVTDISFDPKAQYKGQFGWMVDQGRQGIVRDIILRHYRTGDVMFINPVNFRIYRTIRRGVRTIMTRTDGEPMTDRELVYRLKRLGLTVESEVMDSR